MRTLIVGLGAAVLATAAFANDQTTNEQTTTTTTTSQTTDTQVASMDTSSRAFVKLDADSDGRISAIEAANVPALSAASARARPSLT